MLDLRIQNVRLRGCIYTLYPAASERDTNYDLVQGLLYSIYCKLGLCSDDYEKQKAIEAQNPKIEDRLSIDELKLSGDYSIQDLLDEGLVTHNGNTIVLTLKTLQIFMRAAQIQNELDEIGFYAPGCPHQMF